MGVDVKLQYQTYLYLMYASLGMRRFFASVVR
jgi:hypothetical protein